MVAQCPNRAAASMLNAAQWRALCALRRRFRRDRDLFSEAERSRLSVLRRLYEHGLLLS